MQARRLVVVILAAGTVILAALAGLAVHTALDVRRAESAFPPSGQFTHVEGVRLHYLAAGAGRPVVLLHGNPGFVQDFALDTAALLSLLAREYRVIAFDRPGHGYSDRPSAAGTTPQEQVRLLREALGQLGAARPVLVGHSWGGALALMYALEYPREVAGLVLIGTRAYPRAGRADPLYVITRAPVVGALFRHALLLTVGRRTVDRRLGAAYAPDSVRSAHAAAARALWLRPGQVAATVWDTRNLQVALAAASRRYNELTLRAVILVGARDRGAGESYRLSQVLPRAELVMLPNVGHELQVTRPAVVVEAVRRVLALDGKTTARRNTPR
jgi:pimeloyl-ACP methyl ester carboxylesterase